MHVYRRWGDVCESFHWRDLSSHLAEGDERTELRLPGRGRLTMHRYIISVRMYNTSGGLVNAAYLSPRSDTRALCPCLPHTWLTSPVIYLIIYLFNNTDVFPPRLSLFIIGHTQIAAPHAITRGRRCRIHTSSTGDNLVIAY